MKKKTQEDDDKTIRVWITKFALTRGVFAVYGKISDHAPSMVGWHEDGVETWRAPQYAHGKDWHTSEEAAKTRAEEMRLKKISSLKKQIAAFEKLRF